MNNSIHNETKVLLIDDDPVSNFIVTRKLEKLGLVNIYAVENGAQAIEYLKNNEPDLIFLDINMPIMDGHEFMIEYKERNLPSDINIFVLSSSDRSCDRKKFMDFTNVLGYIEKPLEIESIEKALNTLKMHI
ncbi:response regulator [Maribacter sp. LLG6340-A2]|uniref:response regulator n=1 Tax=Maribacter sp. LLG6340-A2 TaxID=3160834 RepID=UPI00386B0BD4